MFTTHSNTTSTQDQDYTSTLTTEGANAAQNNNGEETRTKVDVLNEIFALRPPEEINSAIFLQD